ncbi:hypothetical protein BCR43DRAFT_234541 [Syncephalastrum racemosum]|uniref:Uncharacterized protein n=1 Tax=Syncephalastrum racemosum TaxID=13706 RepID=A0A1X2HED0_SYNRA|nr:hypothetical protein BCR43DRAFT_234541 [Syncephalastrum racemosum]
MQKVRRSRAAYDGKHYDVLNGEYASCSQGGAKFYQDHRKVLREAKSILDTIIQKSFPSDKAYARPRLPGNPSRRRDDGGETSGLWFIRCGDDDEGSPFFFWVLWKIMLAEQREKTI